MPRVDRAERLLVLGCLAAGGVLRFAPGSPMWLDEALTANIAAGPFGDIADRLRHDGHPPLFYWLLHGWIQLFGDSAAAARALSGVLGLIALVLVWLVGRRYGGASLGTTAAAVLAVSPYGIRYSTEVRMYELVLVLVLAGWLLVDRALAAPRLSRLVPLTLCSGALLLTHYWSLFLVAAFVGGALVLAWRTREPADRHATIRIAIAVALGGVFFLPWLPTFAYQSRHTGTPWAPRSRPTRVVSESLADWTGGAFPESTLLLAVLAPLALLGLFGQRVRDTIVVTRPRERWRVHVVVLLVATITIGSIASFASDAAFAGRYASVYFPFFLLLVAAGLLTLGATWTRVGALALVVLLGLGATGISVLRHDRTQAGAVAAALEQGAQPGDLVVVCPDQLGPALARLVDLPGVRVVRYPDLGDPRLVDWVDYQERYEAIDPAVVAEQTLAAAGTGAIWLEWSDGYPVVGDDCAEFASLLIARRPGSRPVVDADNVRYFEYASLIRLTPPPS